MNVGEARELADSLRGIVGGLKIGLTFWLRHNFSVVRHVTTGFDWFLDLKFFDIGDQMDGAVRAVVQYGPRFISIHEDPRNSDAMKAAMEAAHDEAQKLNVERPLVLAIASLTSMEIPPAEVLTKAYHAQCCGLDGVICSGQEVALLRSELRPDFILMCPGIRPLDTSTDDHKRVATPQAAMKAGANYLVVGRPITKSFDPRQAALDILTASVEGYITRRGD